MNIDAYKKYPLAILYFIKEQLDNENLVKSFSEGELVNNNAQTHWGYANSSENELLDDEYKDTEIRYKDYQKSIYLKDCFGNKYLIRIDCLEDKKND